MIRIFFDNDGNFDWSSVAAMIAFFVGLMSIYNNKKTLKSQKEISDETLKLQKELNEQNFKGNVVSKARIEWIQEVRKKSVDFLTTCHNLLSYMKLKEYDEDKISELKSIIERDSTLLILYFGPGKDDNKNNDFIVYLITLLSNKIINEDNYYEKEHIIALEDEVYVLKDFLRIYLKAEWKRANGEIEETKVQQYLEGHKSYQKIIEIYKSGFSAHEEWVENFYSQLEKKK